MTARSNLSIFAAAIFISFASAESLKLDLNEAIALAIAKNYDVSLRGFDTQIAEKGVLLEKGAFDPTLEMSYGSSSSDSLETDGSVFDRTGNEDLSLSLSGRSHIGTSYRISLDTSTTERETDRSNGSSVSISVTQPLLRNFGFDSNLAATRIAKNRLASAHWSFTNTLMSTVEQVVFAYSDYYFAIENLNIAHRNRDLAEQLLSDNRRRVDIGNIAESDITLAEARYALRVERVINAERLLSNQANRLKRLITDDIENLLDLELSLAPTQEPELIVANARAHLANSLERRPDFQQALLGINNFQLQAKRSRDRVLPQFDLVVGYTQNGSGTGFASGLDSTFRSDGDSGFGGIVFSMPLPNRTNRAQAAQDLLRNDQAEVDLNRLKQAILIDLDNAAVSVNNSWKRIEAAQNARRLAEASLEAEEKKLKAGRSTSFFVLDRQEQVANTAIREVNAVTDYIKAQAAYQRETGIILDNYGVSVSEAYDR